jgi:hypothetical protein
MFDLFCDICGGTDAFGFHIGSPLEFVLNARSDFMVWSGWSCGDHRLVLLSLCTTPALLQIRREGRRPVEA